MNGYERLKTLYKNRENKERNNPLIQIIQYLLSIPEMNEQYLDEEKDLKQMMEFINDRAKKDAINNVAVIEDVTVYKWAIEYFTISNEELGIKKSVVKAPVAQHKKEDKDDNGSDQLNLELE